MKIRMFNNLKDFRSPGLFLILAASLPAAEPSKLAAKAMQQAIAQQRHAVASMSASLQAQRHSLQTQVAHLPAPPPSTLAPLLPLPPLLTSEVPPCPPLPDSTLDALVQDAAQREDLEPDLIRGVIRQESAA